MSVITFVNNEKEQTGKTMSLVAIATYMAINYLKIMRHMKYYLMILLHMMKY